MIVPEAACEAPLQRKSLRIICVGTGRDGTQSVAHMLRSLYGGDPSDTRVMHEYCARDFYNEFAAYREGQGAAPLAQLRRMVAECPHEAIVGNGYAPVLPLFAEHFGHDLALVHLKRANRAACVASLKWDSEMSPTGYGNYSDSPTAEVKRIAAFHFGEMSHREWERLPLDEKFGWFYDKTHALVEEHSTLFSRYIPVTTESLNSEETRRKLTELVADGAILPPPAHLDASVIDIAATVAPEHWHRMRWLIGRLNLAEVVSNDVYALDYFTDKFIAWTGYQINKAPQLGPAVVPSPATIAKNLVRAKASLTRALHEVEGLQQLLGEKRKTRSRPRKPAGDARAKE